MLQSLDAVALPLRTAEALIAHELLGWRFMRDRRGGVMLRPPGTPEWVRNNFDPKSEVVQLDAEEGLPVFSDWDRGGYQTEITDSRAGVYGLPPWSKGVLLDQLFSSLTRAGFTVSVGGTRGRFEVGVARHLSSERTVVRSRSMTRALVRAAAGAIVAHKRALRFPVLPKPL